MIEKLSFGAVQLELGIAKVHDSIAPASRCLHQSCRCRTCYLSTRKHGQCPVHLLLMWSRRRRQIGALYTADVAVQATLLASIPILVAMLPGDALNCVYSGAVLPLTAATGCAHASACSSGNRLSDPL